MPNDDRTSPRFTAATALIASALSVSACVGFDDTETTVEETDSSAQELYNGSDSDHEGVVRLSAGHSCTGAVLNPLINTKASWIITTKDCGPSTHPTIYPPRRTGIRSSYRKDHPYRNLMLVRSASKWSTATFDLAKRSL
jgi:hypothetical protein